MATQEQKLIDYQNRINKVLNFISENLSSRMELETLAQIGCFSAYHFHRLFRAHVGESIGAFIKRKRLEKAAQLLSYSDLSVSSICFDVGYETPSALTYAFQKQFGVSPSQFRKQFKNIKPIKSMEAQEKLDFDLPVRIEEIPAMEVAFVRAKGYSFNSISNAWNTIIPYALEKGFFRPGPNCIGIAVDDPEITSEEECEYNACIVLDQPVKPDGEVSVKALKGGKYAVFTYKGSYSKTGLVYNYIFKHWLTENPYQLRDAEVYDRYLNSMKNTPEDELLTEIHIPIV